MLIYLNILTSLFSGLIAATLGTPADVIKTRIMCQPTDSNGKGLMYHSSWHCLVTTVRNEGFFGLYKGFWPTWLRMVSFKRIILKLY
jgi:solute carrier family 25 uncoupling protein 27